MKLSQRLRDYGLYLRGSTQLDPAEIDRALADWCASKTAAEVVEILEAERVPEAIEIKGRDP